jgi:hypothetical protein
MDTPVIHVREGEGGSTAAILEQLDIREVKIGLTALDRKILADMLDGLREQLAALHSLRSTSVAEQVAYAAKIHLATRVINAVDRAERPS